MDQWIWKKYLWLSGMVVCLLTSTLELIAQKEQGTDMFRISHDNDLFNFPWRESDDAYTGGLRADVFYIKQHASTFFLDRWMPKAGDSAINIFEMGIMQVIYTPHDISIASYQPNDYAYAGGLYATHFLYSYHPKKNYDFQTEIDLGVMGPPALAKQSQTTIHRIIHYQLPQGWSNQLKTDLLFNVNFTAERQIAAVGSFAEIITGAKLFLGTQMNALSLYPIIRIGKMNPYFEGFIRQYSGLSSNRFRKNRRLQLYFVIKPQMQWVLTNAMLEGGLFSGHTNFEGGKRIYYKDYADIYHLVYSFDCGPVIAMGHLSFSLTEDASSRLIKDTYTHRYGNVSVCYSW